MCVANIFCVHLPPILLPEIYTCNHIPVNKCCPYICSDMPPSVYNRPAIAVTYFQRVLSGTRAGVKYLVNCLLLSIHKTQCMIRVTACTMEYVCGCGILPTQDRVITNDRQRGQSLQRDTCLLPPWPRPKDYPSSGRFNETIARGDERF